MKLANRQLTKINIEVIQLARGTSLIKCVSFCSITAFLFTYPALHLGSKVRVNPNSESSRFPEIIEMIIHSVIPNRQIF